VNVLVRWGKFNLVGAVGMAVQLAALAVFNRVRAGHYLWATAMAIEVTLLNNFAWHLHYTWRDRRRGDVLGRCVRFHLANGVVSMIGNLVLMRVLVEGERLPVVAANALAILACSLVNFALGDSWVFARSRRAASGAS
jgi:putative flippase GtrA